MTEKQNYLLIYSKQPIKQLTMRLSKLLTVIPFFLLTAPLIGQDNYLPAYIVYPNGDTIRGLIDFQNWGHNPKMVSFRNETGEQKTIKPLDVRSFFVNGEFFYGSVIQNEMTSNDLQKLDSDPNLKLASDTVFLRRMFGGSKPLYYNILSNDNMQFHIQGDTSVDLLVYKRYLRKEDRVGGGKRDVILENNRYKGQLTLYLAYCPTIQSQVNGMKYSRQSMNKLFSNYYKCIGEAPVLPSEKDKMTLKLTGGFIAGGVYSTLDFKSSVTQYQNLSNADLSNSFSFPAGAVIELIFPRNLGRWAVSSEFLLFSEDFEDTYTKTFSESIYTSNYFLFSINYFKMNLLGRAAIPVGDHLKVIIKGGFAMGKVTAYTNYLLINMKQGELSEQIETSAFNLLDPNAFGVIVGTGFSFKGFSFEPRYEKPAPISKSQLVASSMNRFYFLFGYRF
jgi:hypothetical protein